MKRFVGDKADMLLKWLLFDHLAPLWPSLANLIYPPTPKPSDKPLGQPCGKGHSRLLPRRTLAQQLPTVHAVLTNLLTKLSLTEPSFKNVVVMYLEKTESLLPTIRVKSFENIPMADLEVSNSVYNS